MIAKSTVSRLIRGVAYAALLVPALSVVQAPTIHAQTAAAPKPASIRTLSEQEMVDMMVGTGIQATRATNSEALIKQVREAYAKGAKFTMVETQTIGDDWVVALPGAVGGGGRWEFVLDDVKKAGLPEVEDATVLSMQKLAGYTGRKVDAIIRVESAEATWRAFNVASKLGVPVVDSCLSGRARPETQQSIPDAQGINPAGIGVGVSRWGDTIVFDKIQSPVRREHLMRAAAVASGGAIAIATARYTAPQIKTATIDGSITQAIDWGRTVREATEKGKDPIDALTKVSKGYRLFQGTVSKAEMKGDKGFTFWDVEMNGTGKFTGHTYKIFVKNENMVTWLDGKPDAFAPDFISNLDPKTGRAIVGGDGLGGYEVGREVAIVGIPSSPLWQTAKGIDLIGPRHFGFDFDYVPLDEQMKKRPKI
jgi:DUF917 family protein